MNTDIGALTIIFTEFYYWLTVPVMFLIHVGFCLYEVGVSRHKNMMHTLLKNTMLIPLVTVTFYLFGWWIYFALPNGPFIFEGKGLIDAPNAVPWSELMGTHLGGVPGTDGVSADDTAFWARINGVFWAAFLLFSWTAASIVSGSVIERIRSSAFWLVAVMVGSVTWIIDAAWGWHWDGWMVKLLGYHDAYASGVIHAIAGGAALAVLINLGPRIGKFAADGTPRDIPPRNPWLVAVGLFLIYTGFWGFYIACNVPIIAAGDIGMEGVSYTATNIYLTPTTLSLWGHPSSAFEGYAAINPLGQIAGAFIMFFVLGFAPAWLLSKGLQKAGMLRVPKEIEIAGLDFAELAHQRQAEAELTTAEAAAMSPANK